MKAIVLTKTGGPNVLKITEVVQPEPGEYEVLIKVIYSGVNYADILTRHGLYSWAPKRPSIMGLEVAGEVIKLGSKVSRHKVGDRVFAGMRSGGYAEYAVIDERFAFHPPVFYNWEEIIAFGGQWITAWFALHEMARVRQGEILLVQAAAGGVGTAAIQLAKIYGMEVYGTCSPQKKEVIESLGATYLSYETFDTELKDRGIMIDCVLESIGGEIFWRSFDALGPLGRLVTIGGTGIKLKNKYNPIAVIKALRAIPRVRQSQVLRKSKAFMGLHVGYLLDHADRVLPIWNEMINTIEKHKLRPIYREDQIFPMSKAGEAHEFMNNRKNIGKIILDPSK
ncbi:MAG: zinc-binding dehydrogenase [Candidatus Heimdallarchaeota archaeon]|nr:zinc-binding dehydrogenase [Candidatus Heimdallarchaeota archaeon]